MVRAGEIRHRDGWSGPCDRVVLDYEARHRRRIAMTGENGTAFLLDLPETVLLRAGDGIVLEDGRIVEVAAAVEPLIAVRAGEGVSLTRLAWHIGNRHLPAEMGEDHILIRRDHVIEAMLTGLGARLDEVSAPFNPEGGAYGGHGHRQHGHDSHHSHEADAGTHEHG